MKTKFLFLLNGGGRNIIPLIFVFLVLFQNVFGNNSTCKNYIPEIQKVDRNKNSNISSEVHIIELGISYDQSLDSEFGTPLIARNKIQEVVDAVNCIYEDNFNDNNFIFVLDLKSVRKINLFLSPNTALINWNLAVSNNWNSVSDACNKFDLVHHLTLDLAGVDGHKAANGFCSNNRLNYGRATATISEFQPNNLMATAMIIAHELGHNLGMTHESANYCNQFNGFMCENVISNQNCDQFTVSLSNTVGFKNTLNNSTCSQSNDVNIIIEDCISCDENVYISNVSDKVFNIDYGCNKPDLVFDIESILSNSCAADRKVKLKLLFNDQHIQLTEIDPIYAGPFYINPSPPYKDNVFYETPFIDIDKAESLTDMFKVKVKGTGEYIIPNHETRVNLVYTFQNPFPPNVPTGIKNVDFRFKMNYQLDKSTSPLVKASDLNVPDPLFPFDFCNGVVHDVYLNGNFEVDIDQKYCNTNFYFGADSKVIVKAGKKLELSNCTFQTCGSDRWQGIVMENFSEVIANQSKFSNADIAISCDQTNAIVSVLNNSIFVNNNTGIFVDAGRIEKLENSIFQDCDTGLEIIDSGFLFSDNCKYLNVSIAGIKSTNTTVSVLKNEFSGNGANGKAKGIYQIGTGNALFIKENSSFSKFQIGVVNIRSSLNMENSTFSDNFIGCQILNTPGLTHKISHNDYRNGTYGLLSSNNSSFSQSLVQYNDFSDITFETRISNQLGNFGWDLLNNTYQVTGNGIILSKSGNNVLYENTLQAKTDGRGGSSAKDLITVEGSSNNKVWNNHLFHTSDNNEGSQRRNVFLSGGINNKLHCNDMHDGTYGLNVWNMSRASISANTFDSNYTGLYYGFYPSDGTVLTGEQNHMGNVFENGSFGGNVGAKHLGTNPNDVFLSRYRVDEDENPKYNTTISAVTPDWFTDENTTSPSVQCQDAPPNPLLNNHDIIALIAASTPGNIHFPTYSASLNLAAQDGLYGEIRNGLSSTGLSQTTATNFVNGYNGSPIQILFDAELSVWGDYPHQYLLLQAASDMATAINNFNDVHYHLNIQQHRDSISRIVSLQHALTQAYQTYLDTITSRASIAKMWLSTMSTGDVYTTTKTVWLRYLIDQILLQEPTPSDIDLLITLSKLCPLDGGDAVYGIRSLASLYDDSMTFDDFDACNPATPRTVQHAKVVDMFIQPNPSTGNVMVQCSFDISKIEIVDLCGKSVLVQVGSQSKAQQLDLSDYRHGIYIIRVLGHNGEVITRKISKVNIN